MMVEFSLQLSLTLMGNRSKEVQTLTQLLHVPLSDNKAKERDSPILMHNHTCVLQPSFSGLHTVITVLWERLYFLTEAIWTYLLAHPT